jgi:hypothetical protein
VNRAPALSAVVPVLKGVGVSDIGSRGETLKQSVVSVLAIGVEHGELVGEVWFVVQQ